MCLESAAPLLAKPLAFLLLISAANLIHIFVNYFWARGWRLSWNS